MRKASRRMCGAARWIRSDSLISSLQSVKKYIYIYIYTIPLLCTSILKLLLLQVKELLEAEPMLLEFDASPAYVLGDIHGNYKDLQMFHERLWNLGLKLCPARVLFLGDYVDRYYKKRKTHFKLFSFFSAFLFLIQLLTFS